MAESNQAFSNILIRWYERHKRDLPWRETKDPYAIWLSEIILQQTRVAQGLPYFQKFIARFPAVGSLAQASQEEVLALWQGLGYYSRARNLHACAQMVASQYDGKFPNTYKELLQLKGVGAYTAAAIASFAFNEAVPVVDGNVYRVVSRVFGLHDDISNASTRKVFEGRLVSLIPSDTPGEFNQAIMEFGALHCTPSAPDCKNCVFSHSCFAFRNNEVANLPVKTKKVKVLNRYFNYFVFQFGEEVLMGSRKDKDIWLGLHDFFIREKDELLDEDAALGEVKRLISPESWELIDISATYKHVLTHRIIYARFFRVRILMHEDFRLLSERLGLNTISISDTAGISKPVLITNYLNDTLF
ncbi:A/G-specific adenine glycosylase [Imperialibacter roseus]|uniref:Adenine DNA glycosylase n=1 Tax=Imperialibacter roseus TaxID=1324217 RepID=A0ABZ0IMX0_9BACT|nr:A/G-specific adenine glycosylase [Imperialibacter roseus]WOK06364.1 A/G-specific adenine glycosylase [Imperialibacter roseus]